MATAALQRSDPLVPLPGLLAEWGIPVEQVLAGTGLVPADLVPDRFFEMGVVLAILDDAVARTGREDLGLLLGTRHSVAVLGPLSAVICAAPTLGKAFSDLSALQERNSSAATVYLRRQGKDTFVGYGVHDPRLAISPVIQDIALAVGHRIVVGLTRGGVRPREYLSMRPVPRHRDRWRVLGAEVRFAQPETGFYLSRQDMAFPLPSADRCSYERALDALLCQPELLAEKWTHRTRRALRALLLEGISGMPEVARNLGIGTRSLRRALAQEGTTFETVRDSTRLAIARDLLSMSTLSIGDLALTLDFATPTAFIRAFRRWTQETPSAWRVRNGRREPGASER